ncbi:MAG TPA: glycosyltransferase family 2 protein [Clostridiaceae bacterium]
MNIFILTKLFFNIIYQIFSNVVYIITMYYMSISFFGIIRIKDKRIVKPKKSFAIMVAAHNEEKVIEDNVLSLKELDYPKDMYDIFVIADNCTDKTAERARAAGALVYERFDDTNRGKGYALEWIFEKLFKMEKKYDSVVIFDADNLASKNFLLEMNKKLCDGYKVVQGYLDSKNPEDTWITGSYSISFWTANRMFQLARNNLKLSNQLGGTGFCIDTSILKKLGWGATCLTEDLEFTCKLVLNGYKVGWAHDAKVYDEKPLGLISSMKQRKRWMQGFSDVATRYFFKLFKKSIVEHNFVALDCALYSVQPFVILLLGISLGINIIQNGMMVIRLLSHIDTLFTNFNFNMYIVLGILVIILQFIYTPFMLLLEKKLKLKIFLYYLIYPVFSATWIPVTLAGIIDKDKKEWSHTVHTRNINLKEIEKTN